MTAKVTPLRAAAAPTPPMRTPERQALAAAIERHRVAVAAEANVEAAIGRAADAWNHADAAITAAKAALQEAQEAEPHRMVERMLAGGGPGEGEEIGAAQSALDKAEADQRTAAAAEKLLESELEKTRFEVQRARDGLRSAVGDVLRAAPEHAAAIARIDAVRAEFEDAFHAVATIQRFGGAAKNERGGDISHLLAPIMENLETPSSKAWRAAIEALKHDADAPLPAAGERH